MTEKGKAVYERLKGECLPYIRKLSIEEKYQILKENSITTNLPSSYWNKAHSYFSSAVWEKAEKSYHTDMEAKSYLFLKCNDENSSEVEYFSVLYIKDDIYAEMGSYNVSDFEFSLDIGHVSNIDIIKDAYYRSDAGIDRYKCDVITYSLRNPASIEETRVSPKELSVMLNAVDIPEYEVKPPVNMHEVYER